jgi:transposase-like protein
VVELYATGRQIADLAREFGGAEQSIATWVKQVGRLAQLPDRGAAVVRAHKQARTVAQAQALSMQKRAEL